MLHCKVCLFGILLYYQVFFWDPKAFKENKTDMQLKFSIAFERVSIFLKKRE